MFCVSLMSVQVLLRFAGSSYVMVPSMTSAVALIVPVPDRFWYRFTLKKFVLIVPLSRMM